MIYNQMVTWTAFAILAMFSIFPHDQDLCLLYLLSFRYGHILCLFVCCQYIKRPYGPVGEAAVGRSQAHKGIGPKKTRPPSLTLTLTGRCQIPPGSSVRPIELFFRQVQVKPCKLWQRPFFRISRVEHILILRFISSTQFSRDNFQYGDMAMKEVKGSFVL